MAESQKALTVLFLLVAGFVIARVLTLIVFDRLSRLREQKRGAKQ